MSWSLAINASHDVRGLALLVRKGMAAWMRALSQPPCTRAAVGRPSDESPSKRLDAVAPADASCGGHRANAGEHLGRNDAGQCHRHGGLHMSTEASSKVQARHLSRNAYLYVRQSTLRQVFENTESTKRQYALQQRAVALGWRIEQVVVIDSDLGRSGASAVDREGFQRLVTEVGLGRAGIVMGLEVSRLARNSTDWHRLLEICALADTLILDEDGVYDPAHFNDRLLLGLKGTMSEAELHVLKARLRGGILNKARRGELEVRLPIGFVHDPQGRVRLDPDLRIQDSVRQLLRTFERTGSASATVKAFREQGLMFPRHALKGPRHGEILWSRAHSLADIVRVAQPNLRGRLHLRQNSSAQAARRQHHQQASAAVGVDHAHPRCS